MYFVKAKSDKKNDMINNKNLKVFVYCSSGITRTPTVIMAYLCIYKKIQCWNKIFQVDEILKQYIPYSYPNTMIIQDAIQENKVSI